MARRSKVPPGVAWGDLVPRRACEWRDDEDRVALMVPRMGRGRLGRGLSRLLRSRPYQVHLDDVGSFVWRRCDGSATVAEIAGAMHDAFGEKIEPVEDRLVSFLQQLLRGHFLAVAPGEERRGA